MLQDVKDILLDVAPEMDLNENAPILDQLGQIVGKLNALDIDTNQLLMERNKMFENKLLKEVCTEILLHK